MADHDVVTDEAEGAGYGEDPHISWVAPHILSPRPDTTVFPGFLVDALVTVPPAGEWRLQFFYGGDMIREFRGAPLFGTLIELRVPTDLIRLGAGFYFRLDYKKIGWGDWAYSGNLTMAALPRPTISNVTVSADRKPTISGTGGLSGAKLEIWHENGGEVQLEKILDSAGTWSITAPAAWPIRTYTITARQNFGGHDSAWSSVYTFDINPPRPVISSVSVSADLKPTISGTNGLSGARLEIWYEGSAGGVQLAKALDRDGNWSITAAAAWWPGKHRITAWQSAGGQASDWAITYEFTVTLPEPTITNPGVIWTDRPTLSGTGTAGATVELYQSDVGTIRFAIATVGSNNRWSAPLTESLWMADPFMMTALQTLGGATSYWANPVGFAVLFKPIINQASVVDGMPGISGSGGLEGATVEIWNETGTGTVLLSTVVQSGGAWSVSAREPWQPGKRLIKAKQIGNNTRKSSDWSDTRTLLIKPAKPVITPPPVPATAKQMLAITGVVSAAVTLQMFNESGVLIPGKFNTAANNSTFTPDSNWARGSTRVYAVQTVEGVASDQSALVSVAVYETTRLTIQDPPVPAPATQMLTIRGDFSVDSTLQMTTDAGLAVEGEFSDAGSSQKYFTRNMEWPPGVSAVRVVETFNGETFESNQVDVVVKPFKPVIVPPLEPVEVTQALSITGVWHGAVLLRMLTDKDALVEGDFNGSGTTRTFTPRADWKPGTNQIKVLQTVGGVDSDPSDLATFNAKLPTPYINEPDIPAAAGELLTITNVAPGAVTLQMMTPKNEPVDGQFTGNGNTRTFTPLSNWSVGPSAVKVIQTLDGVPSDDSNMVVLKVKPRQPVIEPPDIPTYLQASLKINNVEFGSVNLEVSTEEGTRVEGRYNQVAPTRTFTPDKSWAAGTTRVKVVQVMQGVRSDASDLVSVMVKPLRPVIEQPVGAVAVRASLKINNVATGDVALQMANEKNERVHGEFTGNGIEASRDFIPAQDWVVGTTRVKVVQTVGDMPSDPSNLVAVSVKPPPPTIEQPAIPVAVRQSLKINNVAPGDVDLRMFTGTDKPVSGEFNGTGTGRDFAPSADWAKGDNTVRVIQTVGNVDSEQSDECTFSVEAGENPEMPQFQLPYAGDNTSTRPLTKVAGLPDAIMTVRLAESDTLHEDKADADGILEFRLETPLIPGAIALEVKQKSEGSESEWSEPHRFTVKHLPQTPTIQSPTPNSYQLRKPTIRGLGEIRGQIHLRHENDPDSPFAVFEGTDTWRWLAKDSWALGHYTISARQTDDGDSSEWTKVPITFEVVDALYGIGDAGPVLGMPVVGSGQSVTLRVQVVSGSTGEAVEKVKVEWREAGKQSVLATTETDLAGWAVYLYTPETTGKSEVLADITNANSGVVMKERYEITALSHDDWAQEAELYLDDERVDLIQGDLLLEKGGAIAHKLELKVNSGSALIGSTVTLQDLWGTRERGLSFFPPLGTPQSIKEDTSVHWYIFTDKGSNGIFGLNLVSPGFTDWQLPGRVAGGDFTESVDVDLDTFPQVFGGEPAYPCLGATHTLTVRPRPESPVLGEDVVLELSPQAAALGVTVSPNTPQTLGENDVSWTLNCAASTKAGHFAMWLTLPASERSSLQLPMSLGHNKVKITERFGPHEWGGGGAYWRYGIRATSTFTGRPAEGVPVTVSVTGKPTEELPTASDGWIYIQYLDRDSANLFIRNRYDGSYA